MMKKLLAVALLAVCSTAHVTPDAARDGPAIDAVLNDFHDAASKADGDRYFGHFAPTAVFLGTDATERWTLAEFRRYASRRFAEGTGWTYHARQRHIFVSEDRQTAWFDEALVNAKYGECRGTGVLVRIDGAWKIAQYNLTIPIPNDIALDVVKMIRQLEHAASEQPADRPD